MSEESKLCDIDSHRSHVAHSERNYLDSGQRYTFTFDCQLNINFELIFDPELPVAFVVVSFISVSCVRW